MAKLRVTIIDEVRDRRLKVDLPDDAAMEKLLPALARKLGLPKADYQLTHEATGQALGGDQTLASFGVGEGHALRLSEAKETPAVPWPAEEEAIPIWQKVPVWAWVGIVLAMAALAFLAGRGVKPVPTPTGVTEVTTPAATSTAMPRPRATPVPTSTPHLAATSVLVPSGEMERVAAGAADQLVVNSWWTAGGDAEALNGMFRIYKEKYPDVEIVNATGTYGADTLQLHAGLEVEGYSPEQYLEPVDDIYASEGLDAVFPADLLTLLKAYGGHYWGVPVNIHRSNVLWYNKAVFADNGLEPPTTFDEFFQVADTLQAAGVTPLALGDNGIWAATHLMESVLLGSLGPDDYRGLWTGDTAWNGAEVQGALDTFAQMMGYVNEDHAALSWDQAAQLVADGDAAMTIMGDWAEGYFKSIGQTPNQEFGWVPSPGTAGTFIMLSDSFGLPQGAPHRDAAVAWLEVCGSQAGQDAFNPLKGSIPARTDGDRSLYDEYLTSAMDDFASNQIAPSLAHGAAASEGWVTAFNDVMTLFVSDLDVASAQSAMAQACTDAGVCQ